MVIHIIRMGLTRCYLIEDKGTILVDCGCPNKFKGFVKSLRRLSIDPGQIGLIVNTHGHFDHVGSARDIQSLTGAGIAMYGADSRWMENAVLPVIPSLNLWGKILLFLALRKRFPPAPVAIQLQDDDFSLAPFGVAGKVVFTPGHTMGSVSVLLESGEAFVGDLAMGGLPFRLSPGLPIFAEDISLVWTSINALKKKGARVIYPAHGKSFLIQKIVS